MPRAAFSGRQIRTLPAEHGVPRVAPRRSPRASAVICWRGRAAAKSDRHQTQSRRRPRGFSFVRSARVLSKYRTDDCGYEDDRGDQEQSTDDPLVQGAAAMLTAWVVFGGSHSSGPECVPARMLRRLISATTSSIDHSRFSLPAAIAGEPRRLPATARGIAAAHRHGHRPLNANQGDIPASKLSSV
jgi:hypothetical protein